MKKMEINKGLRGFLFFFVIVLFGVSGFFLNKEFKKERVKEEKEVLYKYESNLIGSQSAKVAVGKIYDKDIIGQGDFCIGQLVKARMIEFKITYSGKKTDETVSGEYSLKAIVTGNIKNGEAVDKLWDVGLDITPVVKFTNVLPEGEIVYRDIKELDEIIEKLEEIVQYKKLEDPIVNHIVMELVAHVEIKTDVAKDKELPYSESHEIKMEIPKKERYYKIPEDIDDPKSLSKEDKKRVEIPLNRKLITMMASLAGVGVVGLIILIFFTCAALVDEREKLLNKIFKNHGDNMVALVEEDEKKLEGAIRVRDIKDLVRVGEELIRPILYMHNEDQNKIDNFYIINKEEVYLYKVEIQEEEKDDNDGGVNEASEEIALDSEVESADQHKEKALSQDTAILEKDDVIIID